MAARGFIAGPYVWTYNARVIGISADGWRFTQQVYGDPIRGDNLGDSIQDYVYRGGDVTVEAVLNEWDIVISGLTGDAGVTPGAALSSSILWPWAKIGTTGQIGRLGSVVAATLVGTPAPGTTAASATVKNLTVSWAILAPGSNFDQLFAARLRDCPVRLQALPNPLSDSGSETWYAIA